MWLGGEQVVGILKPLPLHPEVDSGALMSVNAAVSHLQRDRSPDRILVRTNPDDVATMIEVLPTAAFPKNQNGVRVNRPTDALAARAVVDENSRNLVMILGVITVIVAAVGVGNMMSASLLERRNEIGLRRALGARRWDIATHFFVEALLLSLIGGAAGLCIGIVVIVGIALQRGVAPTLPPEIVPLAFGIALVVGGVSGVIPAIRAAQLNPADAVR